MLKLRVPKHQSAFHTHNGRMGGSWHAFKKTGASEKSSGEEATSPVRRRAPKCQAWFPIRRPLVRFSLSSPYLYYGLTHDNRWLIGPSLVGNFSLPVRRSAAGFKLTVAERAVARQSLTRRGTALQDPTRPPFFQTRRRGVRVNRLGGPSGRALAALRDG